MLTFPAVRYTGPYVGDAGIRHPESERYEGSVFAREQNGKPLSRGAVRVGTLFLRAHPSTAGWFILPGLIDR
jgi:hypothetical protein